MRKLFFVFNLMSAIIAFGQTSRNVNDFAAVSISGDINAELIKASAPRVEIKMIKGQETDLVTEVSSGELKVKIKNNSWGRNGAKADVKIYYVDIQELKASAGSNVSSREIIKASNLDVDASSGASIKFALEGTKIKVNGSSGSSITISGSCDTAKLRSSSGCRINTSACTIKNVEADASSGSHIDVWVTETIDADSSSGGMVKYKGEPKNKKLSANMSGGVISKE